MTFKVPAKHQPLNFTEHAVEKDGKLSANWQQSMVKLVQRVQAPIVTASPPTSSASPGIEGAISTDGNFVYVYTGGQWLKVNIGLVAF